MAEELESIAGTRLFFPSGPNALLLPAADYHSHVFHTKRHNDGASDRYGEEPILLNKRGGHRDSLKLVVHGVHPPTL